MSELNEQQVKTAESRQRQNLLDTLEKLGGKTVKDDDVTYEGTKFVIPQTMSAKAALDFLARHVAQEEEDTAFQHKFNYRPWDGAYAMANAMKRVTGTSGIGKATYSFFGGKQPPQMVTINIGPNETAQVPWGQIEVPVFEGTMELGAQPDPEYGMVFVVRMTAPRKYRHAIEGLFQVVEEELKNNSIYRGKAIDAADNPNYKDTALVDPSQLVYSEQTIADLSAQLWWPIEETDKVRGLGMSLKRAILLDGPYGTGKTEAGNVTAKKCAENGWTFIHVRANQDDLGQAMKTARLYQPAVVFFEDVDVVADANQDKAGIISRLLDIFDGLDAKNTEIMAVLTTNHVEKIHKGMLRPGRLDGIVHIGALDRPGVEKLAHIRLGRGNVANVDFDQVYEAMEGYMPAFVNRAFALAVEYSRGADTYTTEDLVFAARGLRRQYDLHERAGEGKKRDSFEVIMERVTREAVHNAKVVDYDGDDVGSHGLKIDAEEEKNAIS